MTASVPGNYVICRMPRAFLPGSTIQAAKTNPMPAMPSSGFNPGMS